MNLKIKNILSKLIDNGYEAYIVGGFVRDYLLGIESYDVDISTSAEPKVVREIFDLNNANDDNYGSVCFKDKLYNYDITTFRKENSYENRRPVDLEYIDSIEEDIKRRDFTINALYMDINGEIHDIVNGKEDLNNKLIKMVGNIDEKLREDPLRILRAVRFAATLDFNLDSQLENYIKQNKQLIRTLSVTRKKEELNKIFKNQNKINGINLIKKLNIEEELGIKIEKDIIDSIDPLGIWAQISFDEEYNFNNQEKETIESIKKILDYAIIDNIVLYQYGLHNSIIAGEILGINRSFISDIYKNMPIYSSKDIKINGEDIMKLINIKPGSIIKDIMLDLEINILDNKLINDEKEIREYIIKNWS